VISEKGIRLRLQEHFCITPFRQLALLVGQRHACEDQNRNGFILRPAAQKGEKRHAGPFATLRVRQHDVERNRLDLLCAENLQRLVDSRRVIRSESEQRERRAERSLQQLLIFYDQDARHPLILPESDVC